MSATPGRTNDAPMVRLSATDLSRRFDRRPVLAGTSFTVTAGECLVVTGANGAGKSTLLRIVAGLLSPTGGGVELEVAGAIVRPADRPRSLGYMAPDLHPWSELSARENLLSLARIRGVKHLAAGALDDLEGMGLPRKLHDAPAGTLSTGQRQRLKLAMALLGAPPLLLLDEPGSNLDAEGRAVVARVIGRARGRGAVLLATNDPDEAALAERRLELPVLG
jgi:heme exporter protein A